MFHNCSRKTTPFAHAQWYRSWGAGSAIPLPEAFVCQKLTKPQNWSKTHEMILSWY